MYKLVIDRGVVDDYVNNTSQTLGVSSSSLNSSNYLLLRHRSRPVKDSVCGDSIYPVVMLVTIRTDLTNEVLVPDNGKFYTDCTDSYPNEHPLDDVVMLAAKSLVDRLFDCGDNILSVIQRTTVYPLGACVQNDQVYVYVNVVVDHKLKEDPTFKTKDCNFERITSIIPASPLEEELLKHLILVKGESNNV